LGPPTQGDFRASLVVSRGESVIENVPLALFTVRDGSVTAAQADSPSLAVVHPENR
jgi:hypothetical protein